MSLNAITAAAISGLQTAQTGLRTVSDNISNVNTPGYVRKVVDQVSVSHNGLGSGVSVSQIRLAADRFLQAASLSASSRAGAAGAASALWDQTQSLFGDPSEDGSFFSGLDRMFNGFTTLAAAPTSTAARAGALDQVSSFFTQAQSVSDQLQSLRGQADSRIAGDVENVNQLLSQIDGLNAEISRAHTLSNDTTGPENKQLTLINQLSSLIDIKTSARAGGGVTVRASDGMVLAGDGAATLSYDPSGGAGELSVTTAAGRTQLFGARLTSGEIKGLMDLRNTELPGVSARLGELVGQAADQLNRVHNAYSAVPPPNQLTGHNTGLDLPTAIGGFTGQTTVAITNAAGVVQRRVDVDFSAGTLSVDGGAASAFTPANFLTSLNTALGAFGSAGFSGGALSLTAASGNGVAVADAGAAPSQKAGRSFSAFFGLNDLVRSTGFANYDTGLTAADAHGFTPGGKITFRMTGPDGSRLTDIAVTVPAAPTMTDLLNSLNATGGGVGLYGSFALDADGQLGFTAPTGSGISLSVVQDSTARGVGGPSMTALFGLDQQTRANRAGAFSVRADIAQDPSRLSLAQLNLSAAPGTSSLASGDIRGADALSRAGLTATGFDPAGGGGSLIQSVSDYAAGLAGQIARKSAAADTDRTAAESISQEAEARRTSTEGVNLDQELIQLTTYQQAYAASARMIQASNDLYDVLLNMTK